MNNNSNNSNNNGEDTLKYVDLKDIIFTLKLILK